MKPKNWKIRRKNFCDKTKKVHWKGKTKTSPPWKPLRQWLSFLSTSVWQWWTSKSKVNWTTTRACSYRKTINSHQVHLRWLRLAEKPTVSWETQNRHGEEENETKMEVFAGSLKLKWSGIRWNWWFKWELRWGKLRKCFYLILKSRWQVETSNFRENSKALWWQKNVPKVSEDWRKKISFHGDFCIFSQWKFCNYNHQSTQKTQNLWNSKVSNQFSRNSSLKPFELLK